MNMLRATPDMDTKDCEAHNAILGEVVAALHTLLVASTDAPTLSPSMNQAFLRDVAIPRARDALSKVRGQP